MKIVTKNNIQQISFYRYDGIKEWLKHPITSFPDNTWIISTAFVEQNQWNLLYYKPSPQQYKRIVDVDVFQYREKTKTTVTLPKISLPRKKQDHHWLDGSIGNKLGVFNPLFRWKNGKLQPISPPKRNFQQSTAEQRFALHDNLQRILLWKSQHDLFTEFECTSRILKLREW